MDKVVTLLKPGPEIFFNDNVTYFLFCFSWLVLCVYVYSVSSFVIGCLDQFLGVISIRIKCLIVFIDEDWGF